jgi:uncharacterized protein (TIGR02466 family)
MQFYVESIFPTIIGRTVIDEVDLSVLNRVKKYKYRQLDNDFNSSASISVRLNILDDFPDIKKNILSIFNDYIKNIYKYENDFVMSTSWSTRVKPNTTTTSHNHKNSMFTGVLYLKSKNISPILFEQNPILSSFSIEPSEFNDFNYESWIVKPSSWEIIFFPSHIKHNICRNESDEDRFSIAMNFLPIGIYGKDDSTVNISFNQE